MDEIRDASINKAVAEITARQRALDSDAIASPSRTAPPPPPAPPQEPERVIAAWTESELAQKVGEGSVDISGLQHQLREMTARIEALRPSAELEKAVNGLRSDLAEIGRSLTEALPRRALEDLEIEVKTLGQRIDDSRQSGVDATALASIEHGLAEIREALRGLTPAESLVGFDEAVQGLTKKIDAIASKKEDPAALQQLETAIGALRGMVSHVASNDTLTKVADDVRALAAKVDSLAASETPKLSALENRIDILAAALNASAEAGQAVPRELEKLLSGLVEKLEWVQLSHTDHTALAHLEDRIATLVKRLDASDARLGLLEGVERGLGDLLVYIEQLRDTDGAGAKTSVAKTSSPVVAKTSVAKTSVAETSVVAPAAALERHEDPEIRQTEHNSPASPEDVHGALEHVDRLATIGNDARIDWPPAAPADSLPSALDAPELALHPVAPVFEAAPAPVEAAPLPLTSAASDVTLKLSQIELPQPASSTSRTPIDPSLPPNHPLEPGSLPGRSRQSPSAADRIAASEAVIGSKPPVIADPGGGKPDFIAAARRAAQAASASHDDRKITRTGGTSTTQPKKLTERLRTLAVAAAVVAIVVGGFHVISRILEDGSGAPTPAQAPPAQTAPEGQTEAPRPQSQPPQAQPDQPPRKEPPHVEAEPLAAPPATASSAAAPATIPGPPLDLSAAPHAGARASGAAAGAPTAITGSLPGSHAGVPASSAGGDKLPLAIGGPALRLAALAGDPAAAYEVAVRFAEGRQVPANNEEAARWFEIAAKKGLAPAEFRLGALYEKGLGVQKSLATARDLYRAAAEKGHGKAMHNLAVLYAEGADGNPDYRTAAQWFRKAADRGIADSQYNLAILYARGVGVEQNLGESYKWFFLAAKEGDQDAARKRDEIASRLDQPSLEAARAAADKWKPLPQPADAITVKGAWDAPANGTPPPKPKPHSAKVSAPDAARVN